MNVGLKRAIAVVIIIAIGVVSATVLAEHFSSPQTYAKTIETLDEKRNSVLYDCTVRNISGKIYACLCRYCSFQSADSAGVSADCRIFVYAKRAVS